jgi:regulator of replication initiation timing
MSTTTNIDLDVALNEALTREKMLRDRCLILAQANKALNAQNEALRDEISELKMEAKVSAEHNDG